MSAAERPDDAVMAAFRDAPGFMPEHEGLALFRAAVSAAPVGPLIEIGSYCGRSTLLLGAAAARAGTHVVTIDHHRGSEEHQPGWAFHDPSLMDPDLDALDTLPVFRRVIATSGLEEHVVAVVAPAQVVARYWQHPAGMVFIDGSHTEESAQRDYDSWVPHIAVDGILAIHDVYPDPGEGGQAPLHIYQRALAEDRFDELAPTGSLRLLRRRQPA